MLGWRANKGAGFAFGLLVTARLLPAYNFDPDSDGRSISSHSPALSTYD